MYAGIVFQPGNIICRRPSFVLKVSAWLAYRFDGRHFKCENYGKRDSRLVK